MRVAIIAVFVSISVVLAGCAGPGTPENDSAVEDNGTTFTENERGAHPDAPANDTTPDEATNGTGANGSALVAERV